MNLDITMRACILLYIFATCILTGTSNSRSCIESSNTYRVVQSCPTTEAEVKERARIKDCESLATSQNCSAPSRFKYHCVIDVWETALIEVCAPAFFMLGYCTEYNIQGARIQDHYDRRCTSYSPPCPTRYISTDAYKFPGCYELVEKHDELTPKLTTSINDIVEDQASFVWIAAVFLIIPIIIITFVCYRRIIGTRFNGTWINNDEMDVLDRISQEHMGMAEGPIESEINQPCTKIRPLDKIIQTLKFKRYVVIKGDREDGKTILAEHAMAEMRREKGTKPLEINHYKEWDDLEPGRNNLVIFIDNMFGETSPLHVTQWSTRLRAMKAMVAESTMKAMVAESNDLNYLIITLQTKIFQKICLDPDIKDFLENVIVDIGVDEGYHLTDEEKKHMHNRGKQFLGDNGRNTNPDTLACSPHTDIVKYIISSMGNHSIATQKPMK